MTRTCVFCGKPATTKEHLIPCWPLKRIKGRREIQAHRVGAENVTYQGPNVDIRVPILCGTCNNGWLSELETCTKPILGSLMSGIPTSLDDLSRLTLATWGAKMAILIDASRATGNCFFKEAAVRHVVNTLTPPQDMRVYSARNRSCEPTYYGDGRRIYAPNAWVAQVSTIALEELVMQVVATVAADATPTASGKLKFGDWSSTTVQIWPLTAESPGRVIWPPRESLSITRSVEMFSHRWGVEGARVE